MAFDFPAGAAPGQIYTSPDGVLFSWDGEKWMKGSSGAAAGGGYVLKAGDTMTGFLTLSADPVNPLHAATKQYIDTRAPPAPGVGDDGEALVALSGVATWGAPVNCGNF
jgi:hypothetical protein